MTATRPAGRRVAGGLPGATRSRVARACRLLLLLGLPLAGAVPAQAAPPDLTGLGFEPHPGATLPRDVAFVDQDGRPVTLGTSGAQPLVLVLGYFTCPSLCGIVRDDLFAALARTGLATPADYRLAFVSIDPAEGPADARAALADDLARFPTAGAAQGWRFLTGPQASIAAVEQAVGFHSRFDASLKQFLHPTGVVVATADGTVSGTLTGVGYQPGDLRAAIVRAQAGGIEQAAQPVLLLCFHFDPATGRYTLAIVKLLRLAGVLTVLTITGLLVALRRRERA